MLMHLHDSCTYGVISSWLNVLIIICFGQKRQLNLCNVTSGSVSIIKQITWVKHPVGLINRQVVSLTDLVESRQNGVWVVIRYLEDDLCGHFWWRTVSHRVLIFP